MKQTSFEFEEYAESLADRVLRRLTEGPVTKQELIKISHRFSAPIKTLRLQGHTIERIRQEDCNDIYVWRAFVPQTRVTREMQEAYYTTPHWKHTRQQRLEFDDFRCCHCRATSELQVHHWHYDLFAEAIEDLTTLCSICHTRIHENDLVAVHFPRYVPQDIGQRLEDAMQ
jgi:hypothetical protein